jgi:hypothetical protein
MNQPILSLKILPFIFFLLTSCVQAQSFDWTKGIGGDAGTGVAIDSAGNSFIIGTFQGSITVGQLPLKSAGSTDIIITKCDFAGNILWAKQAGGKGTEYAGGIAADAAGNCYATGYFLDSASFGSFGVKGFGSYDAFLAKYDATGECKWVVKAGGKSDDWGEAVTLDAKGNIYWTGNFQDTAAFGNLMVTTNGDRDVFVAKLDSNGTCVWVSHGGGSWIEEGRGISVDAQGNAYVTGYFTPPAQFGNIRLTSAGSREIFIAKYDSMGNCVWANQARGNYVNMGNGISTDRAGNSTITGYMTSPTVFDQIQLPSSFSTDAFIASYDSHGSCLWAKSIGGNGVATGSGASVDAEGNSYVTGTFSGAVNFGSTQIAANSSDAFLTKYDRTGYCLWVKSAGGNSVDKANGLAMDAKGSVWLAGTYTSPAFFGPYQLTGGGGFVSKLHLPATVPASPSLSSPADGATGVSYTAPLAWNAVSDAVSYRLQVSASPVFSGTIVDQGGITSTSFTVNGLATNTTYYWRVSAVNAAGASAWSAARSFTTLLATPERVTLIGPSNGAIIGADSVRFTWHASVPSVTSYEVELSEDSVVTRVTFDTTITLKVPAGRTEKAYSWRVRAKNINGYGLFSEVRSLLRLTTSVKNDAAAPDEFVLLNNYPNPFNPSTTFAFNLPSRSYVTLKIFDAFGREAAEVFAGELPAGMFSRQWDASGLASGVYFYRLEAGAYSKTKRLLLLK